MSEISLLPSMASENLLLCINYGKNAKVLSLLRSLHGEKRINFPNAFVLLKIEVFFGI